MRTAIQTWLLVTACALLAPVPASAQKADLKAEAIKAWTDMKATMVKISNEMPEETFAYRPTGAQRTFGEQIVHVATANTSFIKSIGGNCVLGCSSPAPKLDAKPTGKAAIIKMLEDSYDYGTVLLNQQTPDSILEPVKVPPFMGGMASRSRVVSFLNEHAWDIYGQMAVYLRLNGKTPPASQRP